MSNCINSNITKIYALTQFNSTSLNSHLSRAYSRARIGKDGFVEVVAAYQSPEGKGWFQGTADAIRRCLWILEQYPVFELLVLPGYHLYKMDYQKLIEAHRNSNADITVAVSTNTTPTHSTEDSDFGYFHVNTENRVTSFSDKPETKGTPSPRTGDIDGTFPSMEIYVISRDTMIKLLTEYLPMANDLRSEVIPVAVSLDMKVNAYKFNGYWEDMRNIEAYYRANLESTKKTSMAYNFNDTDSPLYTLPHHLPPSIITDSVITDSAIGGGCILNRCNIKGTVVGMRTRVGEGAVLEDSIVLGSDKYEMVAMEDDVFRIPAGIGECSRIKKAILDKNVRIGKNVKVVNRDNVEEGNNEAKGYIISKGIVVILRGAVIPDGSII
ncbi:unnamed protein product [Cuscuta campestris]|uniref:Nucleotidyl transferase domain-containing protein n=1 Tax=Cuscuta campestris TaxID=132261 RepID=A0A484LEQ9_9ASTE|nr:unnamed protein product [Cuscuta campestris]